MIISGARKVVVVVFLHCTVAIILSYLYSRKSIIFIIRKYGTCYQKYSY